MVRRLVGVGNSSLRGKAKAGCPSRTGQGTDSQLPISTQVSKCFLQSWVSARTWLKKWWRNGTATNALFPLSCPSFYCQVACQMAQSSPWASCPAQGKQPVSLLVLSSISGESGPGGGSPDLSVRHHHHPHCNPAAAASPAAKAALLNLMAGCCLGVTPACRASNSTKLIFKKF